MKKTIYLALAAVALAFFACTSNPANSDQSSKQQESVENLVEELENEAEVSEIEEIAEQTADSLALVEEPASEEPAAEEPAAEEPAQEDPEEEGTVFLVVDSRAELPCSEKELIELMTVDLNEVDPEANNCRIIVEVIVEKDARISHPVVSRSSGNEKLDAYAIQHVLDKCPRFKEPAKQNGHPVRSKFMLPVFFKK